MGTTGVNLSAFVAVAGDVQRSLITVANSNTRQSNQIAGSLNGGPWTPPQWSNSPLTVLTVPPTASSPTTRYVFDATFRLLHSRRLRKTQHPVLTGANIADHAFLEPARVALEIGMSDAMAAFAQGMWVGSTTKSISAFQTLKNLQVNRTLLTLSTRLDTYYNMLVTEVDAPDDLRTLHGLRATVVLEEIIAGVTVSVASASSARPQATGSTQGGTVQGMPVSASQQQQNVVPSSLFPNAPQYPQVPGAGDVSSNNLGQLQ